MKTNTRFLIISRPILLRMRNVSNEICREDRNTDCMLNNVYLENLAVYEIMWKNSVGPQRSKMKIQRMRIAC